MPLAVPVLLLAWSALAVAAGPFAQSELVIVREGGKEYHRPGCGLVRDGKGVTAMTRAQAEGRKLTAHEACDPEKAAAPPASGKPPASTPPADTTVWVDGGRHYHRDGCKRLGTEARKASLAEAGRKLWPCPACKPPIRPRPR